MEESKTPRRLPSSKKLDAARATLASERRAAHAYAQKAAIESERKARAVLKERSPPKAASPAKAPATAPPKAPVPSPPKVPETAPKPQRVTFSPGSSNPDASPRERRLRVASEQVAADASTVPRPPAPKAEATTEVATADLDAMQTRLAELDAVKSRLSELEALVVRQATAATKMAMALRPAEAPAEAPAPAEAAAAPAAAETVAAAPRVPVIPNLHARSRGPAEAMATPVRRDCGTATEPATAPARPTAAACAPAASAAATPSAAAERAGALRGSWAAKDCPLRQWQLQACASCGGGGGGTKAASAKLAQTFARCLAASMRAGEPPGIGGCDIAPTADGWIECSSCKLRVRAGFRLFEKMWETAQAADATRGPPADAQRWAALLRDERPFPVSPHTGARPVVRPTRAPRPPTRCRPRRAGSPDRRAGASCGRSWRWCTRRIR